MNLKPFVINLHLGLEKPLRILHFTDAHIALADDTDGDAMKEKAAARRGIFFREGNAPMRDPVGFLEEAIEYSKEFDYVAITGDLMDRISNANVKTVRRLLKDLDYIFCTGNHEFCNVKGDIRDGREEAEALLKTVYRSNFVLDSHIVGGVNLVAANNAAYYWTEEQFELLKKEVAKGYPILLFTHSPLEDGVRVIDKNPEGRAQTIRDIIVNDTGESALSMTAKVVDYIATEPLIKATFGGHFHGNFTKEFGDKHTYIIGGLFKGIVAEINID